MAFVVRCCKAALLRFSESLASAVADFGVRVFAISPGLVRTRSTMNIPIFRNLPESEWRPAERAGELVVRLTAGEADALSGCFLHLDDDLPTLVREAERIRKDRLYTLRLLGLDGPKS
ncbi:MAG: SDR family oxidoreductase [Thermoplasmata archaeon]